MVKEKSTSKKVRLNNKNSKRIKFTVLKRNTSKLLRSSVTGKLGPNDFNYFKYWPDHARDFQNEATLMERDFFDWLVLHQLRAKDNTIRAGQQELANATGSGLRFIQKALKKMEKTDVIVKIENGAYMLNPNVLFKGQYPSRKKAISQYEYYKVRQQKKQQKIQDAKLMKKYFEEGPF